MKTSKTPPLLLLALLILAGSVSSQTENENLNLKGCIEYSLKNNPSSTVYRNNVKIANQKSTEAISSYLPQISGSVAFDDNVKRQVTVIPAGVFGPTDQRLQFGNQYQTTATVQLDQTIYDQTVFIAKAGNTVNKDIAKLNVLQNNESIIYNTTIAYYQVLIYNEQEKLVLENEKKYNELLTVLKLQYERGVIKKIDYDKVRVSLNNILSQKTLLQTNKQLATNKLKNAMGMDLKEPLAVIDSLNYEVQVTMPTTSSFEVNNRVDYKLSEKNLLAQDLDIRRKKAAFLPTLSGYARYGAQAFGNDINTSFDKWFDYYSVGLKLSVPIFSGMKKYSQLEQSKLSLLNAQENMKVSLRNYQLEYQNASTQLLSSYNSLNTNKENLELAQSVFESTSLEYQKGVSSLSDFLNSDYSYKEAQSNYINSLLNFLSGRLDYEKSQGTLTTYINQL